MMLEIIIVAAFEDGITKGTLLTLRMMTKICDFCFEVTAGSTQGLPLDMFRGTYVVPEIKHQFSHMQYKQYNHPTIFPIQYIVYWGEAE